MTAKKTKRGIIRDRTVAVPKKYRFGENRQIDACAYKGAGFPTGLQA